MASEEKSGSYLKYGLCGLLSVTLVATPILLGVFFTDFPTEDPGTLLSNCRKFGDLIMLVYTYILRDFKYLFYHQLKGLASIEMKSG